ncbi:hypothetical protein [Microscilla marina]|uniref:Uncharacterized protein n=1 Tax=Microscilla marina ATCC 23134 TaxID=313606 RepID=A1ZHX0_MICM2|nr:hypothetical protein [Microscilla marina]EAY30127.1 hypothetical protein M23134_05460 [Microscilla marina ATCC 23134]
MSISIKVLDTTYARVVHHRLGGQHFMGVSWSRPASKKENEVLWQKALEYAQKHRINLWQLDRSQVSVYTPPETWLQKSWFQPGNDDNSNIIAVVMADQLFCQLLLHEVEPIHQTNPSFHAGLFSDRDKSKDWLLNAVFSEKKILLSA